MVICFGQRPHFGGPYIRDKEPGLKDTLDAERLEELRRKTVRVSESLSVRTWPSHVVHALAKVTIVAMLSVAIATPAAAATAHTGPRALDDLAKAIAVCRECI